MIVLQIYCNSGLSSYSIPRLFVASCTVYAINVVTSETTLAMLQYSDIWIVTCIHATNKFSCSIFTYFPCSKVLPSSMKNSNLLCLFCHIYRVSGQNSWTIFSALAPAASMAAKNSLVAATQLTSLIRETYYSHGMHIERHHESLKSSAATLSLIIVGNMKLRIAAEDYQSIWHSPQIHESCTKTQGNVHRVMRRSRYMLTLACVHVKLRE